MAVNIKSVEISLEEEYAIENEMAEKGYLKHEYVMPAKTLETDVICPVCGGKFSIYLAGDSYSIYCETDLCVVMSFRGL